METWLPIFVAATALLGLAVAGVFTYLVMQADPGNERMRYLSRLIQQGARTFISREYRYILPFLAGMVLLLTFTLKNGWMISICFLFGAACSLFAGFAGLWVTTRTNSRTTEAARTDLSKALTVAFRGGSVMGLTVAGLGLLGLTICFIVFEVVFDVRNSASIVLGFSLGASSVALFLRVGGGIFTKGADVGADMVGKVEEGIPEDDPRNPAVIADNVGDNVGDVAGMGSDLHASFIAAMAAPIVIAATSEVFGVLHERGMLLPMAIGAAGLVCTILGTFLVRGSSSWRPDRPLLFGLCGTAALVTVSCFFLVWGILGWSRIGFFYPLLVGIAAGLGLGSISDYFTSKEYKPVRRIAEASQTGAGTTVISGLSEGMMSTVASVVLLAGASGLSYVAGQSIFPGGGVYGVSLSAIGMLSITGMIVAADSYGCIADNAGGIAEMAGLEEEVRERTDVLDAVGNTTAAISKGYAICAAGLVVLALLAAYANETKWLTIKLIDENTIVGLLLGAMVPLAFGALTLRAVKGAAYTVVEEVRRQFREIAGLREGRPGVEPDYNAVIDITTRTAVRNMMVPAITVLVLPLGIGLLLGLDTLAGFLTGALVGGFICGVWMANAGGAWDNAKKYIEAGNLGGKGTLAHSSAVVGDTVGDPLKDTAGPAINIVIKVLAIVALIFVPLFH